MTAEKIHSLLKTEKTPFYVYDLGELKRRVLFLKSVLPEKISLCYAVKANTFILEELDGMVDYFEICSPGEYRICKKAKLPSNKFVISGVNKEASLIEQILIENDHTGQFTVESMNQFELLRKAARDTGRKISVLLRLTCGNQFGLDIDDLVGLVENYRADQWIGIAGIQFFSGTQKTSLKKIKREIELLDQFISQIYERFSFRISKLEYGPGLPVSYFEGDSFDELAFLNEFSSLLNHMHYDGPITLEIGRSIAASCGTYLTKVVDTKCNHSELYAIVDGGIHQIVYYGQSMAMKQPGIRLLSARDERNIQKWNICGSLCTANDFLGKQYPLPRLEINDVLAFENTGAYCAAEGISMFLSRELPGIVLMDEKGEFKTVRNQLDTERFNTPQKAD